MPTREEIVTEVQTAISELFEIDPAQVTLEARLNEDLDLDSIDAVDLVVRLQNFTGGKVSPSEFRAVRTVKDIVNSVEGLLAGS